MLLLVAVEGCSTLCHKLDHALCDITLSIHNDGGVSLIGFLMFTVVFARNVVGASRSFADKVVLLIAERFFVAISYFVYSK